MAKYKMKSAQQGVLKGAVHPVKFEQGKTYEIDNELAAEFEKLEAVEPSNDDAVEPTPTREDIHENWLDTDPAVLRHGELTAAEVIAKDESPYSEGQQPADQVEGKAEGEEHADDQSEDSATSAKSKKSGK